MEAKTGTPGIEPAPPALAARSLNHWTCHATCLLLPRVPAHASHPRARSASLRLTGRALPRSLPGVVVPSSSRLPTQSRGGGGVPSFWSVLFSSSWQMAICLSKSYHCSFKSILSLLRYSLSATPFLALL